MKQDHTSALILRRSPFSGGRSMFLAALLLAPLAAIGAKARQIGRAHV
jgi:hypothetical protein